MAQHSPPIAATAPTVSVAEVAQRLGLKAEFANDKIEWHGANPQGSGAKTDGFILYPEGNAWDRATDFRYKSNEVARLAGLSPDEYEPCADYRRGAAPSSNGHSNGAARNGAGKSPATSKPAVAAEPKTYDTRTLQERGVSVATLSEFHIALVTRSNRNHQDYRCYEYPAYFAEGRAGRCRQKVLDPVQTGGQKYFWAGGDKDSMPTGYNLPNVARVLAKAKAAGTSSPDVWLVESEVSTWLMHQSGVPCCNPFGANRNHGPLLSQLKSLGVTRVRIAFDADETGRTGAAKAAAAAKAAKLQVVVLKLPGTNGFDVSDLRERCETREAFVAALENLPPVGEAELKRWAQNTAENAAPEDEKTTEEKPDVKLAKAKRVLELVQDATLFHTPDDEAYIVLQREGRAETYPLGDARFSRWVSHKYRRVHGQVLESSVIDNALRVLEGDAFFEGEKREAHMRTAQHDSAIYIDLCNDDWQTVEIKDGQWKVVQNPPVHFRRAKGMEPLPLPERGGSFDELRPLLNAEDDDNWIMMIAWLITALRPPRYPYPILSVHGEQETAKTTLSKMLRKCVDPNFTLLVGTDTADKRDLAIYAKNCYVLAFDNLSSMPKWFNDALCSLVTEGGFRTRKLHTNDEEMLFKAQRPMILNGINDNIGQNDLRRRSIKLWLPPIPQEKKRDEADVWEEFERIWPRVLGCIFDAMAAAQEFVGGVELPHRAGLVDFAKWVIAAEPLLPWAPGRFAEVYLENQQQAIDVANEASPLAREITNFIETHTSWSGSADELLHELNRRASETTRQERSWPKNSVSLGMQLNRIAPNLRAVGIDKTNGKNHGGRIIQLARIQIPNVEPQLPLL